MTLGQIVPAVVSYLSVALATVAGIIGMGLLFTAVTRGPGSLVFTGLPLVMIGLYWAGRALLFAQNRQRQASQHACKRRE